MADWFTRLMQKGHAGVFRSAPRPRDQRYDAIVQTLRERAVHDRAAREHRQRWYQQHLKCDADGAGEGAADRPPALLARLRTKVPCVMTPRARALLDTLGRRFVGATVTFEPGAGRRRAVMLAGGRCAEPMQIGWLEERVESDPATCNVSHQGLSVDTDGGTMLIMQFRYPATPVRVLSTRDAKDVAALELAEIRPAFDLRPVDRVSSPRLVSVTRPEVETMNFVDSREYEAFYLRFKREVLAGIWTSLTGVLANAPGSVFRRGSYYTVLRKPEAARFRIEQSTVDGSGRVVDIGSNRLYDAAPATDILLLYLEGDVLADLADIYFTLQSLDSADAYFLKEEFFAVIRRFWAGSPGLPSHYGGDLAAVVRMSQRVLPMPAQALLLKQDWINLRQALFDRYGQRGDRAPDLSGRCVHKPRLEPAAWPFSSYPAGELNIGLRLHYRQEWRLVETLRGEGIDPSIARDVTARSLGDIVDDAAKAAVEAMKWPIDPDGCLNTGVRDLAAWTDMGIDAECHETSRDICTRLADTMLKVAGRIRDDSGVVVGVRSENENIDDAPAAARCSRLQHRYEVLTRPVEIENVVLVAEKLPAPAEIDRWWVRRHRWILTRVLLDDSLREALDTIERDETEGEAARRRLYEHVRANILHYQRAVWQQENPQQRTMRYRKAGKKVPLDWRFELDCGTINDFGERLAAANVDAQFAAYAGGREADLDQLIDGSGPVAYYANYAVYRMRPEFGSGRVFSMLHFFKSPYLRRNQNSGEPQVEAPARSTIVREFVIDTDGVITDPVQEAGPPALASEEVHADEPFLILEHDTSIEIAGARYIQNAVVQPRDDCEEPTMLIISAARSRVHEQAIVPSATASGLQVGGATDHADSVVLGRDQGTLRPSGGVPAPARGHQRLVFVRDDRRLRLASTMDAGAAHPDERVIVAKADGWLTPSLIAG